MALYVYITDSCREDAASHALVLELERFKERVESSQSTSLFDPFPPPYLVKKKFGNRQGRLITDLRTVGEHGVIVFLAVLIRGDRRYESDFVRDPAGYGNKHFTNLVATGEIEAYVEERTRSDPPPLKPDPTPAEAGFLYGAFDHQSDAPDILVCETPEWVAQVAQDRIAKQLAKLYRPCLDALDAQHGLHFAPVTDKIGWGIWFLRSSDGVLLICPQTATPDEEAEKLARRIAAELQVPGGSGMLRLSRRAYPSIILADDDLWIDLEKEPVANMALSPEESDVLQSARHSDHPFPLFINGRAGSGKSTILQYLFSDLLFHYLQPPGPGPTASPVYLTANGELLRIARTFVERLLKSEAAFTQLAVGDWVSPNKATLDQAFQEFQPFVMSLLAPEARSQRFAPAGRMSYTRFRREWAQRFGRDKDALRDFGPDLSWHVIRSYIKGMSSETFLEPDDYLQLPENQITVTREAFDKVFKRVWNGWYKDIAEDGLWDDQDLTRYVLENELATPTFPVVFCDEAQDFTRLELELLLRISLFSQRSLSASMISRAPFAFAGDQFQTLNPTGFRWDAIKASFVEKFILELDPARRSGRTDLNYRELDYNYRSTRSIVRFGNYVQALRAALFGLPDLKPQQPWSAITRSQPVTWFYADDAEFWKRFRENPSFVVIVPCNEGEEADYVRSDPQLAQYVHLEEDVPTNVLSAGRAKGCEYTEVVVYGFGAAASIDVSRELAADESPLRNDPDKSLPVQYFINRLYVAVSRAKRRLVIVDTRDGFERLWRCAQDNSADHLILPKIKNGLSLWGELIEGMSMGRPDDLTRDTPMDHVENARTYEADGLARHDAFMMRQAAQSYRQAGDMLKYRECRAFAFEFDEQFFEAGQAFLEGGFYLHSLRCYWQAGRPGWDAIVAHLNTSPVVATRMEYAWAAALTNRQTSAGRLADLLDGFVSRLADVKLRDEHLTLPVWPEALETLLSAVDMQWPPTAAGEALLRAHIVPALDRLQAYRWPLPYGPGARLYYRAERYVEAVQLWDRATTPKPNSYGRARALIEPYPATLAALNRLGLREDLIRAYHQRAAVTLEPEMADIVVRALTDTGQIEEAYRLARKASSAETVLSLALAAERAGAPAVATAALQLAVLHLLKARNWPPLMSLLTENSFAPTPEWHQPLAANLVKAGLGDLHIVLVRGLARSDELLTAPHEAQQTISKYLRRRFSARDRNWTQRLTLAELGAATERAGRFVDAIALYESIKRAPDSSLEDQTFAQQRWMVNKQRQLEYEELHGDQARAASVRTELDKEAVHLAGLKPDVFPNYPPLPELVAPDLGSDASRQGAPPDSTVTSPLSTEAPSTDPTVVILGRFKIEISRKNQRLNITNTETMETAFVKTAGRVCGGEVDFREVRSGRWVCDAWGVSINFPEADAEPLEIEAEGSGVLPVDW